MSIRNLAGKPAVLIQRHQELIAHGFLPIGVGTEGLGKKQCWICKYPDLLGYIIWKNPKTGEVRFTGLTCFERCADRISLNEIDKVTLRWAATHRKRLKGTFGLEQTGIIRAMSYKNPITRIYGGDWKKVANMLWIDYTIANDWERQFLETLVYERGKFWNPSGPTATQRRILNQLCLKFLKWRYPDLA